MCSGKGEGDIPGELPAQRKVERYTSKQYVQDMMNGLFDQNVRNWNDMIVERLFDNRLQMAIGNGNL